MQIQNPLLPQERRQLILELLLENGKVVAGDLGTLLGVSEDTVRRDLRELDEQGLLQRVHGGALPRSPAVPSYSQRRTQNIGAKTSIARAAAALLRQGQVIVLDSGTTTEEVARHLEPQLRATIITNSPAIALALGQHEGITIVMTGGTLNKETGVLSGAATLESLATFRTDICLLGICSLHPELGITAIDLEETHVKRLMIQNATEVVALSTTEKLGTAAPFVVAPMTELTHIITEANVTDAMLEPYQKLGITVTRA